MRTADWRAWLLQYALPVVILGLGLPLAWLLGGAKESHIILAWVVAPPLAFLIGFILRPRHVWVVPAILIGPLTILGAVTDPMRTPEIVGGFFLLAFAPFALMIWAGKALRNWLETTIPRLRHRRPHAPSM